MTVHRPGSDVGGSAGAHNEPSQRSYKHGEGNVKGVLAAFNQEKALVVSRGLLRDSTTSNIAKVCLKL